MVLNGKGDAHGINRDTQQKVRDRIAELNYHPNELARGFRMGKTKTIGLIVSDISNRFYARIARNIEDCAWKQGYTVIICSTDELVEKEKEQISLLMDRKVDGLIVSTSQDKPDFFEQLVENGMPHVLIDRSFAGIRSPSVTVDNYGGAQMAARHLMEQGIRKIGLVTITPEHISTISDRVDGFRQALAENNIHIPDEWLVKAPFDRLEGVLFQELSRLYVKGNLPDAFFALNNNLTAACLKCLRELSVAVPQQIALIGFDDVQFFAFTKPSVSAIAQPTDQISESAFQLLIRQIEKKRKVMEQSHVLLPVSIQIRESSNLKIPHHHEDQAV